MSVEVDQDAVDLCRRAIALTPTWNRATRKIFGMVLTAPLDDAATDLVEAARPALDLITRIDPAATCDWGHTWGPGSESAPSYVASRDLGRVAILRARIAFRDGRVDEGLDDAFVALALSRTLNAGRHWQVQGVASKIESLAIDLIARELPGLGRDRLSRLAARFIALRRPVSLADTVRFERDHCLGDRDWEWFDLDVAQARAARLDRLADAIDDLDQARSVQLDAELGESAFDGIEFNYIESVHRYLEIRRSLLLAAIDVVAGGSKAVAKHLDPSDGRPFDLRTWANGFEVGSRFVPAGEDGDRTSVVAGRF